MSNPIKSSLFSGFIKLVVSGVFSKVISIAITWRIAFLLIDEIKTDQYFFISSLVLLFAGLINNLDTIYVMPQTNKFITSPEHSKERNRFLLNFLKIYIAFGLLIILLLISIKHLFYQEYYPTITFFEIATGGLLMLLIVVFNYFNTICYYSRQFNMTAIFIVVIQAITFVALFFSKQNIEIGVILLFQCFSYAVSILFVYQFQHHELSFLKEFFTEKWIVPKKQLIDVIKLQGGFFSAFIQNYIVVILLTSAGLGFISAYNYSNQLVSIPGQFFLSYFSIIVGVKLNNHHIHRFKSNNDDNLDLNKILRSLIVFSTVLTTAVSIFFYVNGSRLLNILFASSGVSQSTLFYASEFLTIIILYLPAAVINVLFSRVLHIAHNVTQVSIVQILFNLLLVLLSVVFSYFWGYIGIAYGITIGYNFFVFLVLPSYIQFKYPTIRVSKITILGALYFLFSIVFFNNLISVIVVENAILKILIDAIFILIYLIATLFVVKKYLSLNIFEWITSFVSKN